MAKNANAFYKELLHKLQKKRDRADEDVREGLENLPIREGGDVNFNNDLAIFCQMRDKGYDYDDIVNAIQKNSPVFDGLEPEQKPRSTRLYIDRIGDSVNQVRLRHSANAYTLAEQAYKLRCEAIMKKYRDMDPSVFGAYQDGSIGLSLVMKDGFSPEVVEAVLKANSPAAELQEARDLYVSTVMNGIREAQGRYRAIAEYNDKKGEDAVREAVTKEEKNAISASNLYCSSAQEYMRNTNTVILTGKDDENILYGIVEKVSKTNLALSEVQRKKLAARDMARLTLPALRRSILEGSPVAIEPGRDTAQYTQDLLAGFQSDYQRRFTKSRDLYPDVLQRFKSVGERIKEEKKAEDDFLSPENTDAMIAKKLLEEHMPTADILRVLQEQSAARRGKEASFRDEDYAKKTLERASNALQAEHDIRFLGKEIPLDKSFDELHAMNIDMTDVYRYYMAQRIQENPSFALRLSDGLADREAIERMLNNFKEANATDLEAAAKDALYAASPRYKLMATGDEYPDRVIESIRKDQQLLTNKRFDDEKIAKDFILERGFVAEGTQIQGKGSRVSKVFDMVKDGKAAVKMLMEQRNIDDIKLALKSLALAGGVAAVGTAVFNLDDYVNNILHSAQRVYERQQAIANWQPEEMHASQRSAADVYLERMHAIYDKKEFLQPSMDVRVMQDMLLSDEFDKEAIKKAINECSPIRVESCRDEHYVDYVEKEANANILVEEEKLKNWQIVPRTEPEASCEDEYDYQKKRMQDSIRLPFRSAMDIKICGTLIKEGFPMDKCVRAISYRSPISPEKEKTGDQPSYGKSIFGQWRKLQQQQEQQLAQQQLLNRVRVRDRKEETDAAGALMGAAVAGAVGFAAADNATEV